jgi:hypothetical protein
MLIKLFGGTVAKEFHAVTPFHKAQAFGRQALEFTCLHLGAVLLALKAALRHLIVVERPFDPGIGAVEEVDLAPEHFFEVGFHAGVTKGRNEGIKDVCDGDRKALPVRHRAWIGLIKGPEAVQLKLIERMGGLGCGVGGFISIVVGLGRHGSLASGPVLSARHPARPSWAAEAVTGGRPFTPPSGPERRGGGRQGSYLFRDAKRGLVPRGGNSLPAALEGASHLTAACPTLEGRAGVGWMSIAQEEESVGDPNRDRDA